jgi:hypothetical protein
VLRQTRKPDDAGNVCRAARESRRPMWRKMSPKGFVGRDSPRGKELSRRFAAGKALSSLSLDPSGLVTLVNKIERLSGGKREAADPHVLVTWVKKILGCQRGRAVARQSASPSTRGGWGQCATLCVTTWVLPGLEEPPPRWGERTTRQRTFSSAGKLKAVGAWRRAGSRCPAS